MRLQLDLSDNRVAKLDALMKEADISTRKDMFNNALSLLEWAIKEVQAGNTIASVNEKDGRYRELHMPVLDAAASNAKHHERAPVLNRFVGASVNNH